LYLLKRPYGSATHYTHTVLGPKSGNTPILPQGEAKTKLGEALKNATVTPIDATFKAEYNWASAQQGPSP